MKHLIALVAMLVFATPMTRAKSSNNSVQAGKSSPGMPASKKGIISRSPKTRKQTTVDQAPKTTHERQRSSSEMHTPAFDHMYRKDGRILYDAGLRF